MLSSYLETALHSIDQIRNTGTFLASFKAKLGESQIEAGGIVHVWEKFRNRQKQDGSGFPVTVCCV
jgi:hypothetical protein